ncbi:MAG: hypothetical protein RIC38_00750, partial [Chromatocurvus sp.]
MIKLALETVGAMVAIGVVMPDESELRAHNHRQQQYCQRSGGSLSMTFQIHNGAEHTLFALLVTFIP